MGRVHRWSCCYHGELGGITGLSLESESDETTFPWTDKTAGDLQSNVEVSGKTISGTLNFIEGGLAETGWLAGDGYFCALKWEDPAEGITSLKVGLVPSAGSGLVECIDDTDRNGVFKVTPSLNQRFVMIQSDGKEERAQYFNLDFTYNEAEG